MSPSSEHPPNRPDDAPNEPADTEDSLGSTRPLVNFETAGADAPAPASGPDSPDAPPASAVGSDAPPASAAGSDAPPALAAEPERRGGSRLFPQLPDDPRLAQEAAVPSGDPAPAGYEPLFEPPAEASTPQAPQPPIATTPAEVSDAGESDTATATEAPSEAGATTSEPDRFAEWARLDASASHWREGSQDYEERGVVSDEARTVLHNGPQNAGRSGRNLPAAIAVGAALAALFFGALWLGEVAVVVLIVIVLVLAAAEFYRAARPLGYRPATLAGLVGVGGLTVGVHLRGVEAYPIVLATAAVTIFCWFLIGIERDHPTANLAITALGLLWIGGLGSFAALMLREPNGDSLLIAAVIGTVVYDVGGYVVGRTTGQSRLAPRISPNKTHEGLIGGIVLSVVVTTLVMNRFPGVFPWTGSLLDALWLSLAVALAAPLGDLSQSLVKRDVNVKDMGNLLPGHGGVFDRFDALLFALPAAYFVGTYVVG